MCVRDCSGEASGTAYVQFESAAMAKDAFARYNEVALDGKPMKIAFDNGSSRVLSSGIRYMHSSLPMAVVSAAGSELSGHDTCIGSIQSVVCSSNAIQANLLSKHMFLCQLSVNC